MLNTDCVLMPVMDELKGIKESGKVDRKKWHEVQEKLYIYIPLIWSIQKYFNFWICSPLSRKYLLNRHEIN